MKKLIIILCAVLLVSAAFTVENKTGYAVTEFTATVSGNDVTLHCEITGTGGDEIIQRGTIQRGVRMNKKGKVIQSSAWYNMCDNSPLQICGTRWVEDTPGELTWTSTHSNLAPGTYEYKINGSYGVNSTAIWSESVFVTIN